jgi:hypothetical protein
LDGTITLHFPLVSVKVENKIACSVIGAFSPDVSDFECRSLESYVAFGLDDSSIDSFATLDLAPDSTKSSSETVSMYPRVLCVGYTSHVASDPASPKFSRSRKAIVDSGATDHMSCYGREVYGVSYKKIRGGVVILANKQQVPCLDVGKIKIVLDGHPVVLHDFTFRLFAACLSLFVSIVDRPVVLSGPIITVLSWAFHVFLSKLMIQWIVWCLLLFLRTFWLLLSAPLVQS